MLSGALARIATPVAGVRLPTRFGRRQTLAGLALLLAVAAIPYGWRWWQVGRFFESTDDADVGGEVTALSPHVAGFVQQILVADNQFVRQGQLLVELDDRDYAAKLAHAEAVVRARTATLANLHAEYALQQAVARQAEADLASRQAAADFAHEDAVRYRVLAATSYGSLQNYQRADAADRTAAAAVLAAAAGGDAARQRLAVINTQIAAAEASLAEAQADRRVAQLDLGYTRIRAPVDGYVGNRAARVGVYLSAGAALLSVIPARGLWVDANFKEDQLARMRPGQTAQIVSDVLPGRNIVGQVLSLSPATGATFSIIPPENATGNFTKIVQRVPVRIAIAGADASLGLLRPGLSATVTVDTRPPDGNR